MPTSIAKTTIREGPYIFYDDGFRNMIEAHIPWLRGRPGTRPVALEPAKTLRNEFNLFSLLNEMGIEAYHHWIIMRLNKYLGPEDFTADTTTLLIPDTNDIEDLRSTYTTVHSIR